MTTKTTRTEYILREATGANWPGSLPYRSAATPVGRGYRTREEAEDRAGVVNRHYNATQGCGLDLRIVERQVGR